MNEIKKTVMWFVIGAIFWLVLCAATFAGFERRNKNSTDKRIEGYADRSENVEKLLGTAEQGLGELEEQMLSAGRKIESGIAGLSDHREQLSECVTGLGEIRTAGDRLTADNIEVTERAGRIEERILVCLQILGATETEDYVLEDYDGGYYDPGGR